MYYLSRVPLPYTGALNVAEGVIFLKHKRGKNGGYQIGLERPGGQKTMYICSVGFGDSPDCMPPEEAMKLVGRPGRLWWFQLRDHIKHYRLYVMQIEVDGAIVKDLVHGQKFLKLDIKHAFEQFVFATFMCGFLIYSILWKGVNRNE